MLSTPPEDLDHLYEPHGELRFQMSSILYVVSVNISLTEDTSHVCFSMLFALIKMPKQALLKLC